MAFRELLLNNLRRKLFALLLAVLVWLTIYFNDKDHRRALLSHPPTNAAVDGSGLSHVRRAFSNDPFRCRPGSRRTASTLEE